MCGITGFWSARRGGLDRRSLDAMTAAIAHRGPDDKGSWVDEEAGIALGHRRLAVIDLTAAGRQPMVSASGRYVIVYNGEIYNHRDLRAEFENGSAAPEWRGHSDTEVMLAAIDRWGAGGALKRLNGMFAFALWDRERRVLTLARDRLGEKPLYYGRMGDNFLFGSELKALALHPAFERDLDREALTAFLRYNYVPSPRSIWRGVSKLAPAHYLEVSENGRTIGEPVPYWDFREAAERGAADPLPDGPMLAADLETLLKDAVSRRMESDVPLGAFLSGGIDSSLIVALMQDLSQTPVRTFTIGFAEQSHDEAVHARAVARHLGTDHTELYVTSEDALALIPRLPEIWDEPFADSSQIPTLLVSEMTRRQVTVSLSGDGGDELFGGYNRYSKGMALWDKFSQVPQPVRRALAKGLRAPATLAGAAAAMSMLPRRYRQLALAERFPKLAHVLEQDSPAALYRRLVSQIAEPAKFVLGGHEPAPPEAPEFRDFRETMMYLDTITYLPDDILAKVDRATMAVSLEARVPFLDHRVVEYAWRLPMSAKIRNGKGKQILRELLYRRVPKRLVERPKMGFGVPIATWLGGPLREWAEALLDTQRLAAEGYLDSQAVGRLWAGFLADGRNADQLWGILMFQAWQSRQEAAPGRSGREALCA